MAMHQQHDDETLRMDVGHAEETADVVGRRLAKALMQEIECKFKRSDE